eukprot:9504877-Karenia_brevis.AAC.1
MQKGYGMHKGTQKGWPHQKASWDPYNHHNNNTYRHYYNNQAWVPQSNFTQFQPLPSGLSQWACTKCHCIHHNMQKKVCRVPGCQGINPYIPQVMPNTAQGPSLADTAWAAKSHGIDASH